MAIHMIDKTNGEAILNHVPGIEESPEASAVDFKTSRNLDTRHSSYRHLASHFLILINRQRWGFASPNSASTKSRKRFPE